MTRLRLLASRLWQYLTSPHVKSHKHFCRFPPFVVVSHAWRPTERTAHPDPEARTLRGVLAPAIQWYMAERAKLIQGGGAYAAPPIRNPWTLDGCDFCVFLEYVPCAATRTLDKSPSD